MRKLRVVLTGVLGLLVTAAFGRVQTAQAVSFGDPHSVGISANPQQPRETQPFQVYHAISNQGPERAENVVLTIEPIQDPRVQFDGFSINVAKPCTGPAAGSVGPGLAPVVCTIGQMGFSNGVIQVTMRYRALTASAGDKVTSHVITSSNDIDMSDNTATKTIKITP